MKTAKSYQSGRTLIILGDENGFRYFYFEDVPDIMGQHPVESWHEFFENLS